MTIFYSFNFNNLSNGNFTEPFLRSNEDGGKTFGESLLLSNDNVNASKVDIYSNNKHVFVVWHQSNSTHSSIALQVGDNLGKSLGSEAILSDYSGNSYPKVFAEQYNVYISWNVDVDNRFDPRLAQDQKELLGYKPKIYFIERRSWKKL